MIVYSIQPLSWVQKMLNGEALLANTNLVEQDWYPQDTWQKAYTWMSDEMIKRVGPPPCDIIYPMWAWVWYDGPNSRPDLRTTTMRNWAKHSQHVLLTLDIQKDNLLISDYNLWHLCLNNWFLGPEEEQWLKIEDATQKNNAKHTSWTRIFDHDWCRVWGEYKEQDQILQATLWSIKPENVIKATLFGAGQKARPFYIKTP